MFVTSQPGRIVGSGSITITQGATETVGAEGLSTRLRVSSDIEVYSADATVLSGGYTALGGEILEFSGTVLLKNSTGSATEASYITYDTI